MDEPAVRRAVQPGSSVYAADPQSPEIALAGAPVAVGIPEAFEHGLICAPEQIVARPVHALGQSQDLLVASTGNNAAFNSSHVSLSCEPLGAGTAGVPVLYTQQPQPSVGFFTKNRLFVRWD